MTEIVVLNDQEADLAENVGGLEALTAREHQVMGYACNGDINQRIADELGISIKTVEVHLRHTYTKFGINGNTNLNRRVKAVLLYREKYPLEFIEENPGIEPLTPREYEVLSLVAEGDTNAKMADELGIAIKTVEGHLRHTYTKFGISKKKYFECTGREIDFDQRVVAELIHNRLEANNYQPTAN